MKTNLNLLSDYELLELLLSINNFKIDSKKLLAEFGSISALINADVENKDIALLFKIIREFNIRLTKEKINHQPIINSWKQLIDYCQITMANLKEEQLRILFLDKNHYLIADELQKNGQMGNVEIDLKAITKQALNCFADSIILIHNHPNGDSKPSNADIITTKKIVEVLKTLEIKVYDHLIIGKNGQYFSCKSEGFL
jgi:DNA repair protein RadC